MAAASDARGRSSNDRLAQKTRMQEILESLAPYILASAIGYGAADLSILSMRDSMLPQKAPPAKTSKQAFLPPPNKSAYQTIVQRNIFNPDGTIPDALSSKGDSAKGGPEVAPVPSQLPLSLVGTVVLSNPAKSIANIEVKSKNQVISVSPTKDIDGIAVLVRVERNKAVFRNSNNGRLEYIDIKTANKLAFAGGAPGATPVARGTGEVKQIAPNKFKLSRDTITRHTQDLSKLLMQASSIPRRKSNGEIDCFILTSFQPDSIFADLGVQQGDCIKTVNGQNIDSPAKAMEMYQAFKNANSIKITVESDGRDIEKEYNIE